LHESLASQLMRAIMVDNSGPEGVLTLVCVTCGDEQYFTEGAPDGRETCHRCGSTVFRRFFTPTERDEATESFLEETRRSVTMEGESPDTSPDEVNELDNP
jgi:predicted  nucleic acid-binding Zn-ribbon protein